MKNKSFLLYALGVFVVAVLGAIAYQQVAVLNAPKSSDEMVLTNSPTETTGTPQNIRTFESNEKDLKLTYSDNWTFVDNTPENQNNTFGKVLQSFMITNYESSKTVSGGLPEDAVRFEGVISLGGNNNTLDQIIDCGGKTISCENIEINGNVFKRATHVLNTGNTLIQLAAKNQDKIYLFTTVISSGPSQQKNLEMAEQLIKSISIIK